MNYWQGVLQLRSIYISHLLIILKKKLGKGLKKRQRKKTTKHLPPIENWSQFKCQARQCWSEHSNILKAVQYLYNRLTFFCHWSKSNYRALAFILHSLSFS